MSEDTRTEGVETAALAEVIHDCHCECKIREGQMGAGHPGVIDRRAARAVVESEWLKDHAKAERKAGAVDALWEIGAWAKRNPGLRMWQLLELVVEHIDRLEASWPSE